MPTVAGGRRRGARRSSSAPIAGGRRVVGVARRRQVPRDRRARRACTCISRLPPSFALTLLVRSDRRSAPARSSSVQQVLDGVGPGVVGFFPRTMDDHLSSELLPARVAAAAATGFGAVAVCCLSGVGLYGLVAWLVERRRREIAVRLALGARPRRSCGIWSWAKRREPPRPDRPGRAAGGGALATRARPMLFGVGPLDRGRSPAGRCRDGRGGRRVAAWGPCRQAVRVDPMSRCGIPEHGPPGCACPSSRSGTLPQFRSPRVLLRALRGRSHSAPVAQLDRALASGARGRRFESCRARHVLPDVAAPRAVFRHAAAGRPAASGHEPERRARHRLQRVRRVHVEARELRAVPVLHIRLGGPVAELASARRRVKRPTGAALILPIDGNFARPSPCAHDRHTHCTWRGQNNGPQHPCRVVCREFCAGTGGWTASGAVCGGGRGKHDRVKSTRPPRKSVSLRTFFVRYLSSLCPPIRSSASRLGRSPGP